MQIPNKFLPTKGENTKKYHPNTIIAFLLTLTLCLSLTFVMVYNRSRVENLTMEQLIIENSNKINDVVSKLLYKTQILSSIILQNDGEVDDFEKMAATIVDDPAILNILIAPDGVVSDVYPLAGNESVLGLDFFKEGAGNKEAAMAKETNQLVLGGPFDSVQGGQILVGRLPIFIDEPDGSRHFWGLVSVTLKYPQALDGAGLQFLKIQGFAYEVWRINPDTGEKQIISDSGYHYNKNVRYIEKHIPLMNADWYFRILPIRAWYEFPETWIAFFISICISLLVTAVMQNNKKLELLKDDYEALSYIDPLTGIYNRRYFIDSASEQMEQSIKTKSDSFIIMLDLDHFKKVNDEYGHQAGDAVLREMTLRITKSLRSQDLFARYGGEEFIIFVSDTDQASVARFAERMRFVIAREPIEANGTRISVTASFGVAAATSANKFEKAISLADDALYKAKEEGRNRVVFYTP